jgi:hypothetical protein
VVPDDEAFGKSGTSGNFLIGRPALFPFGGMEIDEFDRDEDVGGMRRQCDEGGGKCEAGAQSAS